MAVPVLFVPRKDAPVAVMPTGRVAADPAYDAKSFVYVGSASVSEICATALIAAVNKQTESRVFIMCSCLVGLSYQYSVGLPCGKY